MANDMSKFLGKHSVWVLLLVGAVLLCMAGPWSATVWAQKPVPATLVQAATPMLPYLDWLIDPSGKLTVEDMATPQQQASFRPLNLEKIPRETGTVWLRFTLAPRVLEARPSTYLLDMGEGVPGTPTLYVPKHNVLTDTTEWQDFTPSQRSIFLMPDAQTNPVTAYIKMAGMPGLWFTPMLRTPHNAATALERLVRPAVIVVLGVVMLLCLLRGLTERGEWRFWTSLYTGAALLYSVWGVPTASQGNVPMSEIAAVLAPGVALMLLPHVGRHLMHTRESARIIDIQYLLLSLPGAALALLPLVPGFSWTIRFLDLWPLATLLLVPTTLGAWLMGLPGARRFLLGCLLPPLCTALGLLGIGTAVPAPLLATAPLWGVALGALLIAGTAAAQEHSEAGVPVTAANDFLHDPALRVITQEKLAQENAQAQGQEYVHDMNSPLPEPVTWAKDAPPRGPVDSVALAWEEKLRGSLDTLLREGAALADCSLPPLARQHAVTMRDTVKALSEVLSQPLDRPDLSPGDGDAGMNGAGEGSPGVFDLQQILRDAHDSVAITAENKNIALSWFMPPHLASHYVGDGRRLSLCTRLLLESAVRATSRGGVQLAVRRVPESVDTGHLLFSVTDTGAGMPPHDRSSLALARVWELSAAHRGFLGVECSPHGTTISFTLRLQVASAQENAAMQQTAQSMSDFSDGTGQSMQQGSDVRFAPPDAFVSPTFGPSGFSSDSVDRSSLIPPASASAAPSAAKGFPVASGSAVPRIIIADDSLSNRQLLAFFLEGLPYQTQEARSPEEAALFYTHAPASLIVFDGDMPEEDTLEAVGRIRAFEGEYALPPSMVLALTQDESRWPALHDGGFTHALVKPVTRTGLRRTVQELLPPGTVTVVPSPLVESPVQTDKGTDEFASVGVDQSVQTDAALQSVGAQAAVSSTFVPPLASPSVDVVGQDVQQQDDDIIDTGMPLMDENRVPQSDFGPLTMTGPGSADREQSSGDRVESVYPHPAARSATQEVTASAMPTPKVMPDLSNLPEMPDLSDFSGLSDISYMAGMGGQDGMLDIPTGLSDSEADIPLLTLSQDSAFSARSRQEEAVTDDAGVTFSAASMSAGSTFAPMPESPAPSEEPAPVLAAENKVEWVGEATPIESPAIERAQDAKIVMDSPSVSPSTSHTTASAGGPWNFSHAPTTVGEWVGEPMPVPKKPAPLNPVQEHNEDTAHAGPTVSGRLASVLAAPAASEPAAPELATALPASFEPATVTAMPSQPEWPAPQEKASRVAEVADLLTPYTKDSFAAEVDADSEDERFIASSGDSGTGGDRKRVTDFIPLSLEYPVAPQTAAPAHAQASDSSMAARPAPEMAAPVVTGRLGAPKPQVHTTSEPVQTAAPAAQSADVSVTGTMTSQSRAKAPDPYSERLSLIPEESELTSFIIAAPPSSQPAPSTSPVAVVADVLAPVAPAAPAAVPVAPIAPAAPVAPVATPEAPSEADAARHEKFTAAQPAADDSPIPALLEDFDEAIKYAKEGFNRKNIQAVQEASSYIANRSDTCGLRVLARMARCVEGAAKAESMDALINLLPELETAVERNKIALQKK